MYFEDTVTYFDIIVMFSPGKKIEKSKFIQLLYTAKFKTLYFVFLCSAEDLFTLISDKFRMVYKVDGNPQLDSHDWSMYF